MPIQQTTMKSPLGSTVELTEIEAGTQGDIIYNNGTNWVKLNAGTSGQVLKTNGIGANPEWLTQDIIGVPIGAVVSLLKTFTNCPALPSQFVECNGQTLSDAESVFNGEVIPDLNGDNRFLRGQSTSGGTGGTETHTHTTTAGNTEATMGAGVGDTQTAVNHTHPVNAGGTLPTYYEVVWVMRIK